MPVTIEQIDGFARFAKGLILHEHPALSLEACLRQWREEQEVDEVVDEVLRAEVAITAGRFLTLEEADRQIRAELGWAASEP